MGGRSSAGAHPRPRLGARGRRDPGAVVDRRCPTRHRPRPGRRPGRRWSGVAVEHHVAGQEDLFAVATDVLTVLKQDVAFAGELLRSATYEIPVLGESGGGAQRSSFTAPADADRGMGRWTAFGSLRASVSGNSGPGRSWSPGEEADDHCTGLRQAVAALARVPNSIP